VPILYQYAITYNEKYILNLHKNGEKIKTITRTLKENSIESNYGVYLEFEICVKDFDTFSIDVESDRRGTYNLLAETSADTLLA